MVSASKAFVLSSPYLIATKRSLVKSFGFLDLKVVSAKGTALSCNAFGFVGAYSSSNKAYHAGVGTPTLYKGTSQIANLYDNIRTSSPYYLEFSDCDWDTGDGLMLNNYSGFQIEGGQLFSILFYSKILNSSERSSLVDYFTNVKGYIS